MVCLAGGRRRRWHPAIHLGELLTWDDEGVGSLGRPVAILMAALSAIGGSACASDAGPVQLSPTTTSAESAIASPTDPEVTAPPSSTAEKVIPESGTPATESVYLEVDVENDAPALGSMVVGSPVRVVITSDIAREFVFTNESRTLSGTAVAFDFVADEVGFYEIEDAATGELIVSLEAITE